MVFPSTLQYILITEITSVSHEYIHYLNAWSFYRTLLLNNYGFLQDVNVVPPLVAVGIFAATLSASLSTLIGASRVLIALARDKLFGKLHLLSER